MTLSDLKIPYIIITALSLIALAPMPYGYYTLLKIAVTGCAGATAYLKYKNSDRSLLLWACVIVAILFNPIIPIHLSREIWMALNIAVAGLFGFLAFRLVTAGK
jgi:hypothetical protein